METMYNPIPFSPSTTLKTAINAIETRLFFEDVSVFGPAPNLITLKTSESMGETMLMTNVGTDFVDVQRGVEGEVRAWPAGSISARYFTAHDQRIIQENLRLLLASIEAHEAQANNPHGVTKEQVGLENVDNTADADKPVSSAVAAALAEKATTAQMLAIESELSTVSNTASNASVAAATAEERAEKGITDAAAAQSTANTAETKADEAFTKADEVAVQIAEEKGEPNGFASLDSEGKLFEEQLPAKVPLLDDEGLLPIDIIPGGGDAESVNGIKLRVQANALQFSTDGTTWANVIGLYQ